MNSSKKLQQILASWAETTLCLQLGSSFTCLTTS